PRAFELRAAIALTITPAGPGRRRDRWPRRGSWGCSTLRATRSGAASDCVVSFANTSKLSLGGPGRSSIELEEQELWAAPRRPSASPSRARVAVVLAAGRSERLATVTGGGSKALIRLAGVSLVERAIRAVLGAGVEEVLVVVGYHAGPVAAVVRAIRGLTPGRIRIVLAEDWESGNGA